MNLLGSSGDHNDFIGGVQIFDDRLNLSIKRCPVKSLSVVVSSGGYYDVL